MKILVIEDEQALCETIVSYLEEEGYRCEQAGTVELGSEKVNLYEYDCMLVDIGLPDGSGLSLIKELKKCHPETGIIIISAKNSMDDKILGLDLGADDYLTKPFHLPELNSRIKSLLRRRKFEGKQELVIDKITIWPENRQVLINAELLQLTRKEFDLMMFFVSNRGRVLSKESIAEHFGATLPTRPIRSILFIRTSKTCGANCLNGLEPTIFRTFTEQDIPLSYEASN